MKPLRQLQRGLPGSPSPHKGQDKQSPRGKEDKDKGGCVCGSLLRSALRSTRRGTDGHRDSLHQHLRETEVHTHTHAPRNRSMELRERPRKASKPRGRAQLRPERRKLWGSQGPGYR